MLSHPQEAGITGAHPGSHPISSSRTFSSLREGTAWFFLPPSKERLSWGAAQGPHVPWGLMCPGVSGTEDHLGDDQTEENAQAVKMRGTGSLLQREPEKYGTAFEISRCSG